MAPMGFSHVLRLCLQGGGVRIWSGTVAFSSCTITGNTASGVRAHAQTSHRPDGIFTCFALVFAGRRCLCPGWLGDLLIVHHHGQHSLQCACSCSKVPIAPMGKLLTRLPRLTLAQLRTLRSTTAGTCHRDLAISHRPDGKIDLSISNLIFDDECCLDLPVWSTCHLRLKLQKFPSPSWETHVLLVVCRAAVFTFTSAW